MTTTVEFTQPCGCKYQIDVSHDWVDDKEEVESVDLIQHCNLHIPMYEIVQCVVMTWEDETRGKFIISIDKVKGVPYDKE